MTEKESPSTLVIILLALVCISFIVIGAVFLRLNVVIGDMQKSIRGTEYDMGRIENKVMGMSDAIVEIKNKLYQINRTQAIRFPYIKVCQNSSKCRSDYLCIPRGNVFIDSRYLDEGYLFFNSRAEMCLLVGDMLTLGEYGYRLKEDYKLYMVE